MLVLPHCALAKPPFVLPSDAPTPKIEMNLDTKETKDDDHGIVTSMTTTYSSSSSSGEVKMPTRKQSRSVKVKSNQAPSTASSSAATTAAVASPNRSISPKPPIRVCYQGEPGAYSEKSLRELLGPNVIAVARPSFEACYRAVASRECDYACLPVENSLGGSIHENYDLMLRYDLTVVAEHECRVSHCLHAVEGVKREDIKYCMSHPQALAQCDNYLRGLGITPVPMYDTAGSAKLLSDHHSGAKDKKSDRSLPDQCTAQNTAAIASDLAGITYKLNCLDREIEDDDTNFTRFLLLGRSSVSQYLTKETPSKTSIVFTLPNSPGALYKALACFSLRDIDFSKIESRPTSASLLNYLKFRNRAMGKKNRNQADLPRFRYTFYLDFLAGELEEKSQNALHHLREQAEFCRILGSYPQKSALVGPVHDEVEESMLWEHSIDREHVTMLKLPSDDDLLDGGKPLNIGIIGYGSFGEFLGKKFSENHNVRCIDPVDKVTLFFQQFFLRENTN